MKSFKMKALALATLGLGGLVMAGSAFAACPAGASTANGGAWTSQVTLGGTITISSPGYGATATNCKMDTQYTSNGSFNQVTAVDGSPNNETAYRARFYFSADAVTSLGAFDAVQIFTANSSAPYPSSNPTLQILRLTLQGGGATGHNVGIIAACDNGGGNTCVATASIPATGVSVVEIQVLTGASGVGVVNYWVNNNNSGTPTGSVTITGGNAGWVGVKEARLGLATSTSGFRANHLNQILSFDEFDSRRQTFIGF